LSDNFALNLPKNGHDQWNIGGLLYRFTKTRLLQQITGSTVNNDQEKLDL